MAPVTHQRRNYTFDLMGNRESATQGAEAADQAETGYTPNLKQQYETITHSRRVEITGQAIAGATVETLVHDDDGNLTKTAQWDYTWDAENRMTSAEQKPLPVAAGVSTPPPARKRLEFAYDYRHRRIAKKVWVEESGTGLQPVSWRLTKDLRFVYDGWQMIAELDASFATDSGLTGSRVNRTFLWGQDLSGTMTGAGGVGGLLSTTYQGVTYQVCSDANGNVTGLVPTSGPGAGTLVARFDYDPFGNRITNTGPDVELCPFGFSTKYTDSETGIVNYELRPYQPGTGRWLSRDPIEERGGINLYRMVGNDPVNWFDPDGLAPMSGGIGGPQFIPPGGFPRNQGPTQQEIENAKMMCNKYSNPAPKCCGCSGGMNEDTYPPRAIIICKDFIQKYKASAKVKNVADCLIKAESECQWPAP